MRDKIVFLESVRKRQLVLGVEGGLVDRSAWPIDQTILPIEQMMGQNAYGFDVLPLQVIEFNKDVSIEKSPHRYSFSADGEGWGEGVIKTRVKQPFFRKDGKQIKDKEATITIYEAYFILQKGDPVNFSVISYTADRKTSFNGRKVDPKSFLTEFRIGGLPRVLENSQFALRQNLVGMGKTDYGTRVAIDNVDPKSLAQLEINKVGVVNGGSLVDVGLILQEKDNVRNLNQEFDFKYNENDIMGRIKDFYIYPRTEEPVEEFLFSQRLVINNKSIFRIKDEDGHKFKGEDNSASALLGSSLKIVFGLFNIALMAVLDI